MTKPTLPGFTAQVSLYKTSSCYFTARAHRQTGGAVYPALLDQNCFDACHDSNCVQDCFDLPGWPKTACISYCRNQALKCREACTIPDPPPPPPQFPTPWVCELDPVSRALTAPCCRICHRLLSPNIGQTLHTC
jgi:hypothetical protein